MQIRLRTHQWIQNWPHPWSSRPIAIAGLILALSAGGMGYGRWRSAQVEPPAPVVVPEITTVTALGYLEPEGEVVNLAPPTGAQENRVAQLLVQEGEAIQAGQVVAIMDSRDRLQADLAQAEEDVRVARAKLVQIQAGAKQGEIAAQQAEIDRLGAAQAANITAQQATVERLAAEVENAVREQQRYESLYQQGAISASERDSKRLTQDIAQRSLQQAQADLSRLQATRSPEQAQARANLAQIAEVRPVDVAVAQTEVDREIAAVKKAKANLEEAYVRSPQDGIVMEIYTRPGAVVASEGILSVGQTRQMMVVAEVYQSDIAKVSVGKSVQITSDSIEEVLAGSVARIGTQVERQSVINTDPSTNIDGRVIEVHVALDNASSLKAAHLTHLQVEVVIQQ